MKHIFVVHSNLTYLSALGVMSHNNLAIDDCVLISYNYLRSAPVEVIYVPTFEGLLRSRFNFRRYFCASSVIDEHIDYLSGNEPFMLYVSIADKLSRHAMTHRLCIDYHFFEEGMSAYCTTFSLNTLTAHNIRSSFRPRGIMARLRDLKMPLRGYSSRLNAIPIHYNSHCSTSRRYYGFSQYSHICSPVENRVVMDMRSIVNRFSLAPRYMLDNETVWIGDCVDGGDFDAYLVAIETLFINGVLLESDIRRIYAKFHYRDSAVNRDRVLALFVRYGIEVVIIENATIMEVELLFGRSLSLYGTYSTLLFYGGILGHRSYSIARLYNVGIIDQRMPIFWNHVNKL